MSQLKNRALKLEKQTAWLWFEQSITDEFSASILFMLINQDILKQPPLPIWRRIEQGNHECELKRDEVQTEWDRREAEQGELVTPERSDAIEAEMHVFVSALCFALWTEAPRECRAIDGESVMLEMLRDWIGQVRPDAKEWKVATVKRVLEALYSFAVEESTAHAERLQFVQRWKP